MGAYVKKTIHQMELDSFTRAMQERILVEPINDDEFIVTNVDHMSVYKVRQENDHITDCDCPHHFYRGVICKHMVAVSKETGIDLL